MKKRNKLIVAVFETKSLSKTRPTGQQTNGNKNVSKDIIVKYIIINNIYNNERGWMLLVTVFKFSFLLVAVGRFVY